IKELKEQLETLVESLLSTETELTDEQITELSAFLGEISEVLTAVEGKLEIILSELQSANDKENNDKGSNDTKVSETSTIGDNEKQLLTAVENLKETISNVEKKLTETLSDSDKIIPKEEFKSLLTEITSNMEVVSKNTQKTLENNPELLKETVKVADNTTEVTKTQVSEELKVETEVKSTTVTQGEEAKSSNNRSDSQTDDSSKIVKADKLSNDETIKAEETSTDKNVEILKFENTLIRSAKVNNPAKAQVFEKNIMKQVVNHTTSNLNILENGSEMILKLYPKNLGEVAVKLAIDKGVILAEFNVESQSVKEVLQANLADLRTALSNKGFVLEGIDVSVGDNGTNDESRHNNQNSKSKNKFFDILDVEEEILNANTSENSTTIDTLK
ncbi:MAG: flagellar hook-length control protein FliK, partial [Acidaminobacteraceae bacterium]